MTYSDQIVKYLLQEHGKTVTYWQAINHGSKRSDRSRFLWIQAMTKLIQQGKVVQRVRHKVGQRWVRLREDFAQALIYENTRH